MRTLLLDGDVIAFILAANAEQRIDWGDEVTTSVTNEAGLKDQIKERIEGFLERLNADQVIVCLGQKPYFRNALWPEYKAHRSAGWKPKLLDQVKDILASGYKSYARPSLEADDVLGILATHPRLIEGEKVIVTSDKDLKQIRGTHWNPLKPKEPEVSVHEVEGDDFFLFQTLTGDQCDGYPGCPGIGPVKAKKILHPEGGLCYRTIHDLWPEMEKAFMSKGKTAADCLTQARVARILRWTDWDYQRKEVILWNP